MALESRTPPGPIEQKWQYAKSHYKLVNPANKRKHTVIIVGTGLAGASAALAMSLYLAWVLIRDRLECRICWTGHAANAALWLGLALRLLGP